MASFASITAHDDVFDIPLEGVNREEEEDNRTQLEKDINSPSAVIPIQPWLPLKDNMEPYEYARQLQDGKEAAFGQDGRGVIRRCDAGQGRCNSFFWRVNNTPEYERFVPPKWTNYGGVGQWTMCPLCNASEVHAQLVPEAMRRVQQLGRWDQTNQHGTTGSTDNDKPIPTEEELNEMMEQLSQDESLPTVTTPVDAKLGKRKRKKSGNEIAEQFWKDKDGKSALNAEAMKRLKDAIREDENKNRLDAAERRREDNKKQKTSGGKRRRKKRTKKRRKSRRRKRTRKRRKSRRRKRTRKRR